MSKRAKTVTRVLHPDETHWVGDGFLVTSIFSPQTVEDSLSPFILLDYGGPTTFDPSFKRRGVGMHPHRGFETITIAYAGGVEHHDSTGSSGQIGPGDVQWMTAGSGVLHEEMHSDELTRNGGVLEMAQLWLNLPARHKMTAPRYQTLLRDAIPSVSLDGGAATVRVIAGELAGTRGAANTFTPVNVWDLSMKSGAVAELDVPSSHNAAVFVRRGRLESGGTQAAERDLVVFDREGSGMSLRALSDAQAIVLSGEPIDEPVAAYGPFVMNTREEIEQAIADLRNGRFIG